MTSQLLHAFAAANPNPEIANLCRTVMAIHRPMPTTMMIFRIQALDLIHFIRERQGRFDEFNQTINCSFLERNLLQNGSVLGYIPLVDEKFLTQESGPTNKLSTCETCHGDSHSWPGHFGYLSLVLQVYNVGYMSHAVDIWKCICMLEGTVKKAVGTVGVIHDRRKVQDTTSNVLNDTIYLKGSNTPAKLSPSVGPDKALKLFKKMLDEDCELLYLADRPEKLLISNILVPPICIRPSVPVAGGAMRSVWKLKIRVVEYLPVVQLTNSFVHEALSGATAHNKSLWCLWDNLQLSVAHYINNHVRVTDSSQQNGKRITGLVPRQKGKQGRIRKTNY
ncbi:hypothetical protein Lser_V15G19967 [Lactuca serriola]